MWEWIILPALILVVVLSIVTARPKPDRKADGDRTDRNEPRRRGG